MTGDGNNNCTVNDPSNTSNCNSQLSDVEMKDKEPTQEKNYNQQTIEQQERDPHGRPALTIQCRKQMDTEHTNSNIETHLKTPSSSPASPPSPLTASSQTKDNLHTSDHQFKILDIDLYERIIAGYTDIEFTPLIDKINEIRLHCDSQCSVSGVQLRSNNSNEPNHLNAQSTEERRDDLQFNNHEEYEIESIEQIDIPQDPPLFTKNMKINSDIEVDESIAEKKRNLRMETIRQTTESKEQEEGLLHIRFRFPIHKGKKATIRIFYEVADPKAGVYFHQVNGNHSNAMPYMYTHNQLFGAHFWLPCINTLTALTTYSFEITTHADAMVICTGELKKQVLNSENTLKTFHFEQTKTSLVPQSIGFAVGNFKVLPDPELPHVTHFYLPHHNPKSIIHTISFFKRAFLSVENFLGVPYNDIFGSYKQVFVDYAHSNTISFASLTILSSDMIMEENVIEHTLSTRIKITSLLAYQYFGHYIYPRHWADIWLVVGIAGYLSLQFFQKEFGKNEFRYFLINEARELSNMEHHTQPLYCEKYTHPTELLTPILFRKAPLVLYMIEKVISNNNMKSLLTKRLVSVSPSQLVETDLKLPHRYLTTKEFIKSIKKTYAADLKHFAEYWIFSTGIPIFTCGFSYDASRSVVEFVTKQTITNPSAKRFNGNVGVRVHETEGTFDYLIPVEEEHNYFEFPCRSKPRKKQKKKLMEEGIQEKLRIEIPIRWIRIDPELEWIRVVTFKQKEEMWLQQIDKDRDVVAQLESIQAFMLFNRSEQLYQKLEAIMADKSLYYRVRIAAAEALTFFIHPTTKNPGYEAVINYFKSQFFDSSMTYVKPNNFSDIPLYFIKKKIPVVLSAVKNEQNKTPTQIVDFLLQLLKYNDNSENEFSDSFYVASLIKSLGIMNAPEKLHKIFKYLKRIISLDRLSPSYHRVVTTEAVYALANIYCDGKAPVEVDLLLDLFITDGNYHSRKATVEALMKISSNPHSHDKFLFGNIWEAIIKVLEDPNETSKTKSKICDTVSRYFHSCHTDLCTYIRTNMVIQDSCSQSQKPITIMDAPLSRFMMEIRSSEKKNRLLVERIWSLLRSPITHKDMRLRCDYSKLFNALFGSETPNCYRISPFKEKFSAVMDKPFMLSQMRSLVHDRIQAGGAMQLTTIGSKISNSAEDSKSAKRKREEKSQKSEKKKQRKEGKKSKKKEAKEPTALTGVSLQDREPSESIHQQQEVVQPQPIRQTIKIKMSNLEQPSTSITTLEMPVNKQGKEKKKEKNKKDLEEKKSDEQRSMEEHIAKLDKIYKEKTTEDRIPERYIIIKMSTNNARILGKLHFTKTSAAIYRSLPLETNEVAGSKGLIWFALPQIDADANYPEEVQRSVIKNNELAYWCGGNCLCIGYSKTDYSLSKEIRLLEPCNIFGIFKSNVKHWKQLVGSQHVRVERPRRIVLTAPRAQIQLHIDLFCGAAADYVYDVLHVAFKCEATLFGKLLYFNLCPGMPQFEEQKNDELYRDTLELGEVAFWPSLQSSNIVVSTGPTPLNNNKVKLVERCWVIGRVVNKYLIPSVPENFIKQSDVLYFHRRMIRICLTLENSDQKEDEDEMVINEDADGTTDISSSDGINFTAELHDSVTADAIYPLVPFSVTISGSSIISSTNNRKQYLHLPMTSFTFPTNPEQKLTSEPNMEKNILKPGEIAFSLNKQSIIIAFGKQQKALDTNGMADFNSALTTTSSNATNSFTINSANNLTVENNTKDVEEDEDHMKIGVVNEFAKFTDTTALKLPKSFLSKLKETSTINVNITDHAATCKL